MKKPLAIGSWCLYDAAVTPFGSIIGTFIFASYFQNEVASSANEGTILWSHAVAGSGIAIALLSPLLGAIADRTGRRLPWIFIFTLLGIVATAGLWFVRPGTDYVLLALICFGLGMVGTELATVFYNAMLPALVPPNWTGRLSGWGWATGYVGSIVCLLFALYAFLEEGSVFRELLGDEEAAFVRATALMVGVWYALFALPMFLFTPDEPSTGVTIRTAVRQGFSSLRDTVRQVRRFKNILRFLIASAIYRDGLSTVFTFGGLYAGAVFGMTLSELVIFAILLNLTAAAGAALFAFVDDWLGARPTIMISLAGLTLSGVPLMLVDDKDWFWGLAAALGLFIGPAQSAGRSLLARLSPPDMVAEFFGLYNLTGRAVAFAGPLIYGLALQWSDSNRLAMATPLIFFMVGFVIMIFVRERPEDVSPAPALHGTAATVNGD